MTKTYAQLMAEIQSLQGQADALRSRERSEVLDRIKDQIESYELTAAELFGRSAGKRSGKKAAGGKSGRAVFSDGAGRMWGGRGPRPQWLRDALASGKQLDDFRVSGRAEGGAAPSAGERTGKKAGKKAAKKAAAKSRKGGVARYRDDAGNTWSGFGPKPRWLVEALNSGKTLDDMRV